MKPRIAARVAVALLLFVAARQPARAETPPRAVIRVALAPVIVDTMSGIAWRAMTDECNAIWAREGIALTWSGAGDDADVVLPLVFDHREVKKHDPKAADAFGVTVFAGRSQRILVSAARARDVVGQRHGLADSGDSTALDIAMGTMLGRVVAHEVGHALLLTKAHTAGGLMNPSVEAGNLRPALDGQFALSAADRTRLAVRFSNISVGEATLASVTWMDAPPAPSRLRGPR
jgi:hypothetical protein